MVTEEKYNEWMSQDNNDICLNPYPVVNKREQDDPAYFQNCMNGEYGHKGKYILYSELSKSLLWMSEQYNIGDSDVIGCHKRAFSETSFYEMFLGIVSGAKIVIQEENESVSEASQRKIDETCGITTLFMEYEDLFRALNHKNNVHMDYSDMRHVILMLDDIHSMQIKELYQLMHQAEQLQIHRLYQVNGSLTELFTYDFDKDIDIDTIPLGKPMDGLVCYVLNSKLQEQPKNVEGMLYIDISSSEAGSNGMLNHPLNRDSLICTGLYASYNQSGDILYLGRSGESDEHRRYRRELNELLLTLLRHEAVRDAAIKMIGHTDGSINLYAYIVRSKSIEANELKEYLTNEVSRKIIPQRFIFINKIKDKERITYVSDTLVNISAKDKEHNELKTLNEIILGEIWKKILGVEKVNPSSSFFSMGGDSIKAILMLAELNERGLELDMKELLLHPNIRELALQVKTKKVVAALEEENTITPVIKYGEAEIADIIEYVSRKTGYHEEIKYIYPLTYTQERMLFYSLFHPAQGTFVQQYVFNIEGIFDIELFKRAICKVVSRYDILRTLFIFKGAQNALQVVLKEREVNVVYTNLTEAKAEEYEQLCKEIICKDKEQAFNLWKDSLMRFHVIEGEGERFCIVWSHHHIILDGWCAGIILTDILGLYREYACGISYKMSTPVPYYKYIKWLQGIDQNKSLSYWKEYLKNIDSSKKISKIHTNNVKSYGVGIFEFVIEREITSRINSFVKSEGVTLNTLVQCIWGIMLQAVLDTNDVVFGAIVSGRPPQVSGIEGMIGLFVNAIPVRVDHHEENLRQLMERIHTSSLLAQEHSYISVMELQNEMKMKSELFDHVIAFENLPFKEIVNQSAEGMFKITGSKVLQETNYNLNVIINPDEEIHIELNYNKECFEEACIYRISENIRKMMTAALDHNDITVEALKSIVSLKDIVN